MNLLLAKSGVGIATKVLVLVGVFGISIGLAWMMQDLGETRAERDIAIQVTQNNAETMANLLDQIDTIRERENQLREELNSLHDAYNEAEQEIVELDDDWLDRPINWPLEK